MAQVTFPEVSSLLPPPPGVNAKMGPDGLQGPLNQIIATNNQILSSFTQGVQGFVNGLGTSVAQAVGTAAPPPLPMAGLPSPFGVQSSDRSRERMVPASYTERVVWQ